MAKNKRRLSGAALKEFKHSVSLLKKKGLVSKKTDARKQQPTRYMLRKVEVLKPVLEGKLAPVKRKRGVREEYKKAGFATSGQYILVEPQVARKIRATPQSEGEYMRYAELVGESGDFVKEIIVLPATVHSFSQFIARAQKGDFNGLKRPQDVWAFTFFGNNSAATFGSMDLLCQWLEHYEAVLNDHPAAWANFVLFRVHPASYWDPKGGPRQQYYRSLRRRFRKVDKKGRSVGGRGQRKGFMTADEMRERENNYRKGRRANETPQQAEERKRKNREQMKRKRDETRKRDYKPRGSK